ncbi:hypothetical protein VOI32_38395 [Paraburkholderia caribensis]|uniref:Uncharacterized protein n=1 Tax=Paraburkholderia caribensis TaxID=75105 RepID=A0ABV0E8L5_9BURK|nr:MULTISPECIES: hypothetical protein [Paraburkholderia]MCO4882545.1 hypothetical protein [Paraburkholderia caribensis]PTB24095.1 hypothetical protein C9I56_35710 [Paraburkholderia caribensis]
MNNDLRVRLLLALQSSLLGHITANIRAVTCSVSGNDITVGVVFDGEISEEDAETMEEVGSELASHFDRESVNVQCLRVDAPGPLRSKTLELWAYKRKE